MDFWSSYKTISLKLKKRFMRKPNLGEVIEQYGQLFSALKREGNHQYAAFCCLAIARCDQAMGHTMPEAEHHLDAGRLFIEAQKEPDSIDFLGFDLLCTEAIQCYQHAIQIYVDLKRLPLAATLCLELATSLKCLNRVEEAASYFERGASYQLDTPLTRIHSLWLAAECRIQLRDYDCALLILGSVAQLTQGKEGLSKEQLELVSVREFITKCELTRLFLILILQPDYRLHKGETAKVVGQFMEDPQESRLYMSCELMYLCQAFVEALREKSVERMRQLHGELWPLLTPLHNELVLHVLAHHNDAER
eukprot:Colp12_sorted_trinity150504_noHs@28682